MLYRINQYQTVRSRLLRLPLFLLLCGIASATMMVPAVHASIIRELETARTFFYSGILGLIIAGLVALAHSGRKTRQGALGPLLSLFSAFVFLPLLLAVPFYESLKTTTFLHAYIEMVSSITTTGATLYDEPARLNDSLHLWRAIVGWMGGLLMWVAASAILAPLNLGGFEVTARAKVKNRETFNLGMALPETRAHIVSVGLVLLPIYAGLTGLLWVLLALSGDSSLVAVCHAMSVMATSGISPVGGLIQTSSGLLGEVFILFFMLFALSRLTFSKDTVIADTGGLLRDPEFRIGLALMVFVPFFLFFRHFWGAYNVALDTDIRGAFLAMWGSVFTVLSFLTTTGFSSSEWGAAQAWSGLETPGVLLMGLALIGGGVATTAGGVKLLRVFALYQNGLREMERLIHPSSVSDNSGFGKRLQKDGAFIAWIFFMLFALSLALVTIAFTALDVPFDTALVMTVAGLSTTGPLLEFGGDGPIMLVETTSSVKCIFAAAMVLGRLETLAIIALITQDLWRN